MTTLSIPHIPGQIRNRKNIWAFYIGCALLAVIFLAFVAGYATQYFALMKGSFLDHAMLAGRSIHAQLLDYRDPFKSTRWTWQEDSRTGVVQYDPARSWDGYTVYTSGHDTAAMLTDMDGNEVWRWQLDFNKAWPDAEHLTAVAQQDNMLWRKALLYEDGSILAIYDGEGVTPSGHGLVKLDKNSRLIWKYSQSVHHDVQIDEAGNIYALIYSFEQEPVPGIPELVPPMLVDSVVVLNPDGQEIKRINVLDAIAQSPYRWLLKAATPNPLGDYFHTNSVQPISAEVAAAFDFVEPGQILISMRELSAAVLLDPDTGKAVWAIRGPWLGQHDAELLPNGNMLVFDNKGDISGTNGFTRVLEFDPTTLATKWQYSGSPDAPFSSDIRGAQQRLPNGNTLITDAANGRLFEVTPDNDIVWDFRNPVRGGEGGAYVPVVMWGERYAPHEVEFLND